MRRALFVAFLYLAPCGCGVDSAEPATDAPSSNPASTSAATDEGARIRFGLDERRSLALPGGQRRSIASLLEIPSPLRYGQFVWNEAGIPNDKVWIRVDLTAQTLSVFRGGHEIGAAVILYGADSHPTPRGRFPILAKLKDHRSSLYDAAMPYTLRLTGDGVAIHGSNVRYGAATHGCIGIPEAFAAHVFAAVLPGDPVFIVPEDSHGRFPTEIAPGNQKFPPSPGSGIWAAPQLSSTTDAG